MSRFPLDIVFRIYDNVLASGIEALFSFSLCLLHKNEDALLSMKFDQLLVFLNTNMLDIYQVYLLMISIDVVGAEKWSRLEYQMMKPGHRCMILITTCKMLSR
jgi:hypothetical protein